MSDELGAARGAGYALEEPDVSTDRLQRIVIHIAMTGQMEVTMDAMVVQTILEELIELRAALDPA
jgi:hypothetical protein